jgi:hypothetical protein
MAAHSKDRKARPLSAVQAEKLPLLLRRPHGCHGYEEVDRWWLTSFGVEPRRMREKSHFPISTPWGTGTVRTYEPALELLREEVFRVISAPGKPLTGHDCVPEWSWLPDSEFCKLPDTPTESSFKLALEARDGEDEIQRSRRLALEMLRLAVSSPAEDDPEPSRIEPANVYRSLAKLERDYRNSELGASRELTKDNLEYSDVLSKKLRAIGNELTDARTKRLCPNSDELVVDLADNLERMAKRLEYISNFIGEERELEDLKRVLRPCSSLGEFVRGPLADCYRHLFDPNAGSLRNSTRFHRFAAAFFRLVEREVPKNTIDSALNLSKR